MVHFAEKIMITKILSPFKIFCLKNHNIYGVKCKTYLHFGHELGYVKDFQTLL